MKFSFVNGFCNLYRGISCSCSRKTKYGRKRRVNAQRSFLLTNTQQGDWTKQNAVTSAADDDDVNIRNVVDDFEPDRGVAGNESQVVDGVKEDGVLLSLVLENNGKTFDVPFNTNSAYLL